MDPKFAVVVGFGVGMVLFFIVERTGILYKWFDKWDNL